MKFNSWIKIAVAVLCLLSILCFAVACGDKEEEKTEPATETPTEATEPVSSDAVEEVQDNDNAADIGKEVILPPV